MQGFRVLGASLILFAVVRCGGSSDSDASNSGGSAGIGVGGVGATGGVGAMGGVGGALCCEEYPPECLCAATQTCVQAGCSCSGYTCPSGCEVITGPCQLYLDAGTDAEQEAGPDAPPADGPFACGTETCTATEYCIHPCCGGAPPACEPKPDSGTCPPGSHDGCSQGCSSAGGCCEADPCTPPPPYCADQPVSGCQLQGHDCVLSCA